jgi:hypothetical protein
LLLILWQSHSSQYDLTFARLLALPPFLHHTLGESECADEVFEVQVREMQALQDGPLSTFGTMGIGLNLMRCMGAPSLYFLDLPPSSFGYNPLLPRTTCFPRPRPKLNLLNKLPVDVLVVECGSWQCPKHSNISFQWESCVREASPCLRPKWVIEVWSPNSLLWDHGPAGKGLRVRWEERGYSTKMQVFDSQHCGGAIVQPRAFIVLD